MSETSANNKRIAKNTLLLYFRMLLIMAVTLYTSRVVLEVLGVEDFGIYNVVGGVVALFSFINGAMTTATQRFLNFELGRKEEDSAKRVFSMSMNIHVCIALLVIVLAETVGLWFLLYKMNIPEERMTAAVWCYQLSILTACVQIVRVPYNACIIAYERMSFYAYISIAEVILRLLIVYLLAISHYDYLITYSILMLVVTIIVNGIYKIICNWNFTISKYTFFWDKSLFLKLMNFSGWSLFGSAANVGAQQGLNILLNLFHGVSLNAAMGIANQVCSAVYSFVSSFQTAFNPQIVKSYAAGEQEYFNRLIFQASKYSYFLLFLLALPFMLNSEFLLGVWLKDVPEYAARFSQLILCFLLVDALSAPLWISVQAMGNIKNYQLMMSFLILLNLPLSYIALFLGSSPESILYIRVFVNLITHGTRIVYLHKRISFPTWTYTKDVIGVVLLVTILSIPLPYWIADMGNSWSGFIFSSIVSVFMTLSVIYLVGLSNEEKVFVKKIVLTKLQGK